MKKAQYVKHLDISNYTNIAGFHCISCVPISSTKNTVAILYTRTL